MKLPLVQPLWPGLVPAVGSPDAAPELAKPSSPAAWLPLHALFYATSMAVGVHFSRLIVYLLFLPTPPIDPTAHHVSPPVMLAGANATIMTTTTVNGLQIAQRRRALPAYLRLSPLGTSVDRLGRLSAQGAILAE